jgi:8-oxo-dGTP diphosphatase
MNKCSNPTDECNQKPFKLSVKVLIIDANNCCLVLRRSSSSKANAGKWDFPGGKIDPGESFEEGLIREVQEETGLSISLRGVIGAGESESPSARIAYLMMKAIPASGEVRLSDEHDEYLWVDCRELRTVDLCPQFHNMLDQLIKGCL